MACVSLVEGMGNVSMRGGASSAVLMPCENQGQTVSYDPQLPMPWTTLHCKAAFPFCGFVMVAICMRQQQMRPCIPSQEGFYFILQQPSLILPFWSTHFTVASCHASWSNHSHLAHTQVGAREAMELRDAILEAGDLRQPVNFNEQLMKNSQTMLDSEVSQSLIQLLSSKRPSKVRACVCLCV